MKPTTRRSVIAGTVLGVFAASASYAAPKDTPPGLAKKTPRATPTDVGPGSASFTNTPSPTLPPTEWTATPTNTASATSPLTRTPAPTKTPVPPTATASGVFPYEDPNGERAQLIAELNRTRAENGLYALPRLEGLMRIAQWKAEDMRAREYSAHQIPAGACYSGAFGSRCFETPVYIWDLYYLEGIAWNPSAAENLWLGSALEDQQAEVSNRVFAGSGSHYAAMLDDWEGIGTGMAYDASPMNGTAGQSVHVVEAYTDLGGAQSATPTPPPAGYVVEVTRSSDGRLSQARARRR
jgi:uncharacterized protein YkwD